MAFYAKIDANHPNDRVLRGEWPNGAGRADAQDRLGDVAVGFRV